MNWSKFEEEIDKSRDLKFQYGTHDCMQFVNRVYKTLKGDVLCPEAVNRYTTGFGAYRALQIEAEGDYKKLIDKYLPRIDKNLAQKGDVVLYDTKTEEGDAIGICLGTQFCGVSFVGLFFLPMQLSKIALRVL